MSDEQALLLGENSNPSDAPPISERSVSVLEASDDEAPGGEASEHILQARNSEKRAAPLETPDSVAGLDHAVQTAADEPGRHSALDFASEGPAGPDSEIADAIETLVRVALEMDDPVAALEEGVESLAEALTARDFAVEEQQQADAAQWADERSAYQHARFHRVSELVDVGYSFDQAVAITNANEMEIRARAAAQGADPMDAIYRYAVLNGYQGRLLPPPVTPRNQPAHVEYRESGDPTWTLADLVGLNDEAFAEATKGDRWQMLMRP